MGLIKGQKEFEKFEKGEKLSRKQAMLANCFICNGLEDSAEDCQGKSCPLYQYQPYRGKRKRNLERESGSFIHISNKENGGVL